MKLQRALLDNLKVYINPQIFKQEMEERDRAEGKKNSGTKWEKVNMDFEHQSKTAALYGKPELADPLTEALATYNEALRRHDRDAVLFDPSAPHDPEDEVLG